MRAYDGKSTIPGKFLLQSVVAQWRTEQIVESAECELAQTCRMEQDLE